MRGKPDEKRFYVLAQVRERFITSAVWAPDAAGATKIVTNHYNWKSKVLGVMEVEGIRAIERMQGRALSVAERDHLIEHGRLPDGGE